jgi:hypothetical protein
MVQLIERGRNVAIVASEPLINIVIPTIHVALQTTILVPACYSQFLVISYKGLLENQLFCLFSNGSVVDMMSVFFFFHICFSLFFTGVGK